MQLNINLSTAGANPSEQSELASTAAQIENFFDNIFTAPVTLNVNLDFGTLPPTAAADNDGFGAHSTVVAYDSVRANLVAMGAPGSGTLPGPQPASLVLTDAQAAALGLGGSTNLDGTINLGAISFDFDLFGEIAHEMTEIMGRGAGLSEIGMTGTTVLDLYRYSGVGEYALNEPLNTPAYFSLDGGKTNQGQFFPTMAAGSGFDPGDWDNPAPNPPDAFGFASADGPMTARDFLEMNALGWSEQGLPGTPTVITTVQGNNGPTPAITGTVSNVDDDFHDLRYEIDAGPVFDATSFVGAGNSFSLTLGDLENNVGVLTGTHTIKFQAEDVLGQFSAVDSVTLTISSPPPPPPPPPPPSSNPPIVIAGAIVSYTVGSSPVVADSILTVGDSESQTLVRATVSIDPTEFVAGDQLNFTNQNGIGGSYNATTGVLTLSGTSSVDDYQTALDSITFSSTAADPTQGGRDPSRALSWQVNDGELSSAVEESVVDIKSPPPQPPHPGFPPPFITDNPAPPGGTSGFMILTNTDTGSSEIYDLGSNTILAAYSLGGVGTGLTIQSVGAFNGNDVADMLYRDLATGDFTVFDASSNSVTSESDLGTVGGNWKLASFGLPQAGGSDMVLRNSSDGDFELYQVRNNVIVGAADIGNAGMDWQVAGFGRFDGNDTDDMILRHTNNGDFEVYDANSTGLLGATSLGEVGLDWQVSGFGNFVGDGTTDMMLRNSHTGDFELYDIRNNQIVGAQNIGTVGLDWQVVGFTSANGVGTSDMLLRQQGTGTFEVYDLSHGQLANAQVLGNVGTDWQVAGSSVAAQAAQLIQAMASFGANGTAPNITPSAVSGDSTQTLLAASQHA